MGNRNGARAAGHGEEEGEVRRRPWMESSSGLAELEELIPANTEGESFVLETREHMLREYWLALRMNTNSQFQTIQTAVFGDSQYQFQF